MVRPFAHPEGRTRAPVHLVTPSYSLTHLLAYYLHKRGRRLLEKLVEAIACNRVGVDKEDIGHITQHYDMDG